MLADPPAEDASPSSDALASGEVLGPAPILLGQVL